jgi:hypothetical protein
VATERDSLALRLPGELLQLLLKDVIGGFNWSSQRLIVEGCDGQAGWVDDAVDRSGVDEVAGQAVVAA